MAAPAWQDRELDAVVYGCTGDTGALGCCWLFYYGKKMGIEKWAPAARNIDKMQKEVLDKFSDKDPGADGVSFSLPIKADASDYQSLLAMCKKTKLVIACAGPYELFGEAVIQACVEVGTHYVDVTGEYFWVADMEAKYGEQAIAKGVTLISCAGYDSVPPDLSTNLAAIALQGQGEEIARLDNFLSVSGGAMPSGTIETAFLGLTGLRRAVCGCLTCGLYTCFCAPKKTVEEPKVTQDAEAPLQSSPKGQYVPDSEKQILGSNAFWNVCPSWSSLGKRFSVIHFMAPININVVHRTAAQEGYGGLTYRERMTMGVGCCSLWGLLPTMLFMFVLLILLLIAILPCGDAILRKCFLSGNPAQIARVKVKMFGGCGQTGAISLRGYGISKSGKATVEVQLDSTYDAGLGFTMLSATTVGSLLLKQYKSGEAKPRAGFQTAVRALGGQQLFEALKHMGVEASVTVTKHP